MTGGAAPIRPQPGAVVLGSDFKALAVVRSLGRQGVPCAVVDDLPRAAWFSRHVTRRLRWRGAMWGPAFLDFLIQLGTTEGLRGWVLLPMQDEVVELVARNRQALAGIFRLATQDWQVIRWAQDKRLVHQVARELGIPYPATWYPANADALAGMDLPYPVIVKPAMSIQLQYATGRKAFPARNPVELAEQYRSAAALMDRDAVMVQDVIPGDGQTQLSVAGFYKDGTLLSGMTARRRRQYPFDYGLSSTFVEAVEIPGLVETAQRLVRRMGISGPVEVEFKHDVRDGVDKLLDVNVRLWGWHGLCRACGLDFAHMQFRDALGEVPAPASAVYGRQWRRLVTDVPAAIQEMRRGTLSLRAYLRSLRGSTVPAVFDLRDPLPALADVVIAASRSLQPGSRGHAPIHAGMPAGALSRS